MTLPSDIMAEVINWYVFKTQSGRSKIAEWHLRHQGFNIFIPKIKVTRRRGGKLIDVIEPMFPNYGFISFDGSPSYWRSINSTRGVSYLISTDNKAQTLPHGFINSLLSNSNNSGDGYIEFGNNLNIGSKVELMSGPFAHQFGTLEKLDTSGRVRILMQMLGGEVPVLVSANAVIAAE